MRGEFLVGLLLMFASCRAEHLPSRAPRSQILEAASPIVPAEWELDPALKALKPPTCPSDSIAAETIAFLKFNVRFEYEIDVDHLGRVQSVKILRAIPRDNIDQRIGTFAQACLRNAVFVQPPYAPYHMKVAVEFRGRDQH